jgi:CDP-glycerol glycerophosphotransferase (TagB/SpsB family)
MKLKADVFVMTMPDIETYHLKRSLIADVHYVYLFHAMVSTHSNYRKSAFDHFDTIFLTGSYQEKEIRETERIYRLPPKALFNFGYPRLESLMADVKQWRDENTPNNLTAQPTRIILAPSWGDDSILELMGEKIVKILLDANLFVTVRPHPKTTKQRGDIIENLQRAFSGNANFLLEIDVRDKSSLYSSDIMISDWSGIAMEYAFSCERPVIFIDVPQKCNNPEASRIEVEPIEATIREKVGVIVSPKNLNQLPELIATMAASKNSLLEDIDRLRRETVFNIDTSVIVGAVQLIQLAKKHSGNGEKPLIKP